jgi:type IV pilus assembly protein PilW
LSQADVQRIKAIRVALIVRSGEYEKPEPGQNCTTTTNPPAIPTNPPAIPQFPGTTLNTTFDTTNWPADWQCYRYKVYETIIPLRNAIWAAS